MSKIISKGRKTWKDGSVMTYSITDDGVLTISGSLRNGRLAPFKSKAPFRHLVIENGVVTESGTHEELLKKCLLYKVMWDAHSSVKDNTDEAKAVDSKKEAV